MSWTDERTAELQKLWKEGLSAEEIAAHLGDCTQNAVNGKLHRLGLTEKKVSESAVQVSHESDTLVTTLDRLFRIKRRKNMTATVATVMKSRENTCKWPIGHVGESNFHFCGKAVALAPYCAAHAKKAIQK